MLDFEHAEEFPWKYPADEDQWLDSAVVCRSKAKTGVKVNASLNANLSRYFVGLLAVLDYFLGTAFVCVWYTALFLSGQY